MGGLLRDLRIASRALRKSPAFTTVAIVVLALGIGLSTTVYTILDGVLRQPLPYPEPDRLVMIWDVSRDDPSQRSVVAPGSVEDWQEQSGSFEAIALYNLISLTIAAEDERRRADGIVVTPEYFDVVRIAPALGRPLTRPADDDGGATPMVISHAFWRDRFGGRPEAIGRSIDTGSGEFEVVGVMPEGYRGPEEFVLGPSSFWIPFPPRSERRGAAPATCGRSPAWVLASRSRARGGGWPAWPTGCRSSSPTPTRSGPRPSSACTTRSCATAGPRSACWRRRWRWCS